MLGELLHDEEVLFSVWLTLKVAAVCLALHLITAVPLALWARSPKAPFRRTLNFVVTLPLVFPPIALGYLLLMALGQTGLGEPLQRLVGVRLNLPHRQAGQIRASIFGHGQVLKQAVQPFAKAAQFAFCHSHTSLSQTGKPRSFPLVIFQKFTRHGHIGFAALAVRLVKIDGHTKTGCFRKTHGARHNGFVNLVAIVLFDLCNHLHG